MKDIYKHTKTTVSLVNYHFVFCPRYRRKIFLIPGVEDVFKKEAISICQKTILIFWQWNVMWIMCTFCKCSSTNANS